MAELFASGRLVDLVLVIVAIEAVALITLWRWTGRGVPPRELLPNLIAGALLLVALRLTLAGAGWMAICGCLAAAGIANVIDLMQRWRNERLSRDDAGRPG
jgi:prepilin signal peptidase PulO-like enzyme (type II secretory pathway)